MVLQGRQAIAYLYKFQEMQGSRTIRLVSCGEMWVPLIANRSHAFG